MTDADLIRNFMLAGFTPAEQTAFLYAWDTDAADLTEAQASLIHRFYAVAAADDPDDATSADLAQIAGGHAAVLRGLREVA